MSDRDDPAKDNQPAPPSAKEIMPHRGRLVLAMGILALVTAISFLGGLVFGAFACVMANRDIRWMDAGLMEASGRRITNAGRTCGRIAAMLSLVGGAFSMIYELVMMVMGK